MKTSRYKHLIAVIFTCLLSFQLSAQETAIVEAFSCNYADGKNRNDLDSAIEYWQKGMKDMQSDAMKNYFAAVLHPIRSSSDSDFYWLGVNATMTEWAQGFTEYSSGKFGRSADARFEKMSKCQSNLHMSTPLYVALTPNPENNGAVMIALGCNLHKGKDIQNAMAIESARIAYLKAAKIQSSVYRLLPYIGNSPYDIIYLVVYPDASVFASAADGYMASAEWMATNNMLRNTMSCSSGLYESNIVHFPMNQQ